MSEQPNFSDLVGRTLSAVERSADDEEMLFVADDGARFKLYHMQDCCESVTINDVCGELTDLIGAPILQAEEAESRDEPPAEGADESYTWTFYKLATIKGAVTIRWFGSSNGFYSESVDFARLPAE